MGNQTRSRPKQSTRSKNTGGQGQGNRRRRRRSQTDGYPEDDGNLEIIPPDELELSKDSMHLTELKTRSAAALVELGESLGLENFARLRKQDIIFNILRACAKNGEDIYGDDIS